MARKASSKTAPIVNKSQDIQMPAGEDLEVKKRGHNTDTEDAPRKKSRNQGCETMDSVSGKKVQRLLIAILII
jgi:hypothetical protein